MAIGRKRLIKEARIDKQDLKEIKKRRRDYNRLGYAYQLTFVRVFNRMPTTIPFEINSEIVSYVASRLQLQTILIEEYHKRRQTITEHQASLINYLKLSRFDEQATDKLKSFIFNQSLRLEQSAALETLAKQFLREQKILQPAQYTIVRLIGEQRSLAREYIFSKILTEISEPIAEELDKLLKVNEDSSLSALQKIKDNPQKPSPDAMLKLIHKLHSIEAMGILELDLSWLNRNYQRTLFHYVRRSTAHRLRDLAKPRRIASLTCFLHQAYRDAIDQSIDMFDKLITLVSTRADRDIDEAMRQQRKMFRNSINLSQYVATLILDESLSDGEKIAKILEAYPEEALRELVTHTTEWVSGKHSNSFHLIVKRIKYLRRFTPLFLNALRFNQTNDQSSLSCMSALDVLIKLNNNNQRKLPDDVPTDFIPKKLKPLVIKDDTVDRKAWECALLLQLRDEIKVGNVYVSDSKRFGNFEDYLISEKQWSAQRESFFVKANLPQNPKEVGMFLKKKLNTAYDNFFELVAKGQGVTFSDDTWQLTSDGNSSTLTNQEEHSLELFRSWISRNMRKIRLPELLIEVDNQLNFTRYFTSQSQNRSPESICAILATIMAHGCNIGLYTMESLIEGFSYSQLKRVSDWQITPQAQKQALAAVADGISALDISMHWGDGKASASDGQRFAYPRKQLQQNFSTKFKDFALEFYSFIANNYAPFFSRPIECQERDAAFVLDGLLYNESDLEIEEHYTDTHGYTEINFAAFTMLGRRFCPRIKGLHAQNIYRIDTERDYGVLAEAVSKSERTIKTAYIAEQWDMMGRFYASLEAGHTTASVALKRLVSYPRKNLFYRANQDLGRVYKTIFLLEYMTEPKLRQRIRRGLLKVEELHQLARDIFFAKRGRIVAKDIHQQMNACSSLTLVAACVIYWQAQEITKLLKQQDEEVQKFDLKLLSHISPIGWDNVILYGQYRLNPKLVK